MFRRLRALHGNAAAENEAGHPVDPRVLARVGLPCPALYVVLAREAHAYALGIEAACGRRPDQHVAVGEIAAFGEIEIHQPLLHAPRMTCLAGPQDQAMAIERIGLALDVIEVI